MNLKQGRVLEVTNRGIWVEVTMAGTYVKYGPMDYVSSTGAAVAFGPGDRVLIGQYGPVRDTYIILGKVLTVIAPAATEQTT